jgi:hypothetical protein
MSAMESILCKRIDCKASASNLEGWRLLFEDGYTEDVPAHIIARSQTLDNSANAASEIAKESFVLTVPRGVVLSWLDCLSNLRFKEESLRESGLEQLLAYLQVCLRDFLGVVNAVVADLFVSCLQEHASGIVRYPGCKMANVRCRHRTSWETVIQFRTCAWH